MWSRRRAEQAGAWVADGVARAALVGACDLPDVEFNADQVPAVLVAVAMFCIADMHAGKKRAVDQVGPELEYIEHVVDLVESGSTRDDDIDEKVSRAMAKAAHVRNRAAVHEADVHLTNAEAAKTMSAMDSALRSAHRFSQYLSYKLPEITISAELLEIGQTRANEAEQVLRARLHNVENRKGIA